MPAQDGGQPAAGDGRRGDPGMMRTIVQSIAMFVLIQFVMKQFLGGGGGGSSSAPADGQAPAKTAIPSFDERPQILEGQYSAIPQQVAPIWSDNTTVDISIYVSPSMFLPALDKVTSDTRVMHETGLKLDNSKDTRDIHATFKVPKEVQNNGTLFAHIYIAQTGEVADPQSSKYDPAKAYHIVRPLNSYRVKKRKAKTRNLLSDEAVEEEQAEEEPQKRLVASYYHPNLTMSLVPSPGQIDFVRMHPAMREHVHLETTGARDASGQNSWYYPIIFLNTFWQLQKHSIELNDTVTELDLNIHLNHQQYWLFNIISSMDFGTKVNQAKYAAGESIPGGGDGSEMEQIKAIILDSNIYLLSTTVIVGIFHTIFEMLAFKNDVSHWRNKKDNVGVSMRTILANVIMKLIVFLYLLDQMESTSYMILAGEGFGVAIEAWKITKTVDVRVRPTAADETRLPWKFLPYTIVFEDKHKLSETEEKTKEYDEIAFRYLYWIAIPLLAAYAGYSLYYETHKGWYSFILTTLVGSVYAYGFLMMVPSLYINYRLKSVAHMPGRAMTYKFLNTFIDDLFAFTVKMPTLHRLATLRDDVIFFVYLYQCWFYKVDYSRVNEFGQGGEDEEVVEKKAAQPLTSPAGGQTKAVEDLSKATGSSSKEGASVKKRK